MALNRMMIFAVIPAVLASPAPAKAQGQNSGVDLDRPEIVCTVAYEALGTMDWIQREIVNMDEIDTQFRSESLVRPLGPDYAAATVAAGIHLRTALSSEEARTFRHEDWLIQSEGYDAASFNGQIEQRGDGLWQITGTPVAGPDADFCSDLIATRFLPEPVAE